MMLTLLDEKRLSSRCASRMSFQAISGAAKYSAGNVEASVAKPQNWCGGLISRG
ncbi:hypothetical protein [Rhizobium sp. AC44/96]|uniref:hypothetical protein n=1 Tax=Rhizobium sp. AC44/96 TaxID=1841654 RepID=UPI00130178F7|nr:hypothetical protein [Rhizobium sp. AC44/96]